MYRIKTTTILFSLTFLVLSCTSKDNNTGPRESDNSTSTIILVEDSVETEPFLTVDSSKIVNELPPYEGMVKYSDKRLNIKSSGVNIATELIDINGMRSQKLIVSDPRSGTKCSYIFDGDDAIGWLLPGNKEDIIYVVTLGGNRNGFSITEFDLKAMEPVRDLIQGIGIFGLVKNDSCFEIRLDAPWSYYGETVGAWSWLERYDFEGNLLYQGDSLFVKMSD